MVCLINGVRLGEISLSKQHEFVVLVANTHQPSSVGVLNGQTRVRHGHQPAFQRSELPRVLFAPSVHKVQIQVGGGVVDGIPHAIGIHRRVRPWHDMASSSRGERSLDKSALDRAW